MAYEIVWTNEATFDLFEIADYLKENWSLNTAEKFIGETVNTLERLAKMPSLARKTINGYLMFKLDRKNVVFFMLKNHELVVLSIYPYKKDISKSKYY